MPPMPIHLALPKTLYLETTNRCNLRCKGCILYRGPWEPYRDITLQDLSLITAQMPELERAVLHGIGEPLLNESLPEMIRHLKKQGAFVLFNSNGILLTEKWQKELIYSNLDELRISLDAASPQGYQAIRNEDHFDQIVGNLKSLLTLQEQLHTPLPKLSLWFLGTKDNIGEFPDFVRLAATIGVKEVYLQRLVYFQNDEGYGLARPNKSLQNCVNVYSKLIQKSQELAGELGVTLQASGLADPIDSLKGETVPRMPWSHCRRPSTLLYVTANGNVLPCCISPFSSADYKAIILGNIFKAPLAEIWRGPAYDTFRKDHQTESAPLCCRGCGVLWSL